MSRKQIDHQYQAYVKRYGYLNPSMAWIIHPQAMSNFIAFASA